MTIIEQAARRLEALRRAGVEVSWAAAEQRSQDVEGEKHLAQVSGQGRPVGLGQVVVSADSAANGTVNSSLAARSVRPQAMARSVDLDLDRLSKAGYITPIAVPELAKLAAEFRIIKRPLMRTVDAARGDPAKRTNLIMVTSSVPGEGKTFNAINLAMSIAMEVDRTVLLVDADVIRPSILDRCGLPASKGLMDMLTKPSTELGDVLLRTNVPKLALLPAGTPHPNATELLASAAMEGLLEELANRYSDRIVVFDAPPLLPSPESRVLAARVGQVVVVVEQGRSTREAVTRAFSTLQSCPHVTSILNKCRGQDQNSLYGEYYGSLLAS